ncbi:Tim17/Tim22/Tim23/Pmp24 family-domain-containing protein, partial [Entophlyctis helioformis]
HSNDHTRDPCPYNIVSDVGIGFAMGSIGGSLWHGVKGYMNAPRGERFVGSIASIKARAPITGGNFAVWSGLFNANDCLIADLRGKEDGWNPIMAGAATGAILAARSGPKGMMISAVFGGIILAAFEGIGAVMSKMGGSAHIDPKPIELPPAPASEDTKKVSAAPSGSGSALSQSGSEPVFQDPFQEQQQQQQQQQQPAAAPFQGGGFFKGRFGVTQ